MDIFPQNRHLKIFISSTFEDMHNEREILLKNVFLELKHTAKERDVDITEIDLRWGITSEEADTGHTVKICLDEIERCKDSPIFFLGMLGNRYGWCDWHTATHIKFLNSKKYSWIKKYIGKSITELEINYAIRENNIHNKVFLFLKEDREDDDIKLKNLKNDLRNRAKNDKMIYLDSYTTIDDFKDKALTSMLKALDELFPIDKKTSQIEKLRQSHYIFAKTRQKLYIPYQNNEKILDNFLLSNNDKLLIYGALGLGKTALVSNYIKKMREKGNYFIIEHYIGGAGELSSDLSQMLKRVMLEIKEKFSIDDIIPSNPEKILSDFSIWLNHITKPTLIVFDGYNQIDDKDKIKLFAYLPQKLKHVKLIITSIKDNYAIKERHEILALNKSKQKNLIDSYFEKYGKKLSSKIIEKIINHKQTDNTLFLKTLLEEIRLLNRYERLEEDIDKYLNVDNTRGLFIKIFKRLEKDYKSDLVIDVLSLIWVARDGLSEDNIIEIINLNKADKSLTRLDFSLLFLAIQEHLVNKNGLYSFFHSYIEEAVKNRYLNEENKIKKYREWIVNYFINQPVDNQVVRELPYHLYSLKNKKTLIIVLMKIDVFLLLFDKDKYELLKYFNFT